jgi:NAD/NADP transhydrogenase beta subunit
MNEEISKRSDDGKARLSVHFLIQELENQMKTRGGNYMNITGMNLAIVKTLINHINKLEDRVDELQGMIEASSHHIRRLEGMIDND